MWGETRAPSGFCGLTELGAAAPSQADLSRPCLLLPPISCGASSGPVRPFLSALAGAAGVSEPGRPSNYCWSNPETPESCPVRGQDGGYSRTEKRTARPGRADSCSELSEETQGPGWLGLSQGSHRGWGSWGRQSFQAGAVWGWSGVCPGRLLLRPAAYPPCTLEKPFKASTFISADGYAAGWLPGMRLWGR